ncbi:mycothiol synthase [Streptacidiphilus sp. BW17]|uniref:GNAT family N-acetyltransferase n=1 Tax=Streptacidiphilus sp. BW17 TaxID=3156274 RepID=UPI003511F780
MSADRAADRAGEAPSDYVWRPIGTADVTAWVRLIDAIEADQQTDDNFSEQDLLEDFDSPNQDYPRGSMSVWDGDRMVGFAVLIARSATNPAHESRQRGGVDPEYRGRGIGTELLRWAERAALPLHEERFPGCALALNSGCPVDAEPTMELFHRLGYEQIRWFHDMKVADLAEAVAGLPPTPAPRGVVVRQFTSQRSADALRVRNDSFRDHFDYTPMDPESWARFVEGSAFRAQYSLVAYDEAGGAPLGIVLGEEFEKQRQVTGKRNLYVALVGTARAGRKRGIASALLTHVLRIAQADGFDTASLGVDADSPTGAPSVYERVGFRPAKTWVAQRKLIKAAEAAEADASGSAEG